MRKIAVLLLLAIAGCATPLPSFRQFVRENSSPNNNQYPIIVNYNVGIDALTKDARRQNNYVLLNWDINSKNFSLTVAGEEKISVQLAHFNKPMTHWDILWEFRQQHFRPANIQEFLCFAQKYSWNLRNMSYSLENIGEDQIEIICLGASRHFAQNFYSQVPRLGFSDYVSDIPKMPIVDLVPLELNWLPNSYFAVVGMDEREEDAEIKPKTLNSDFGKEKE